MSYANALLYSKAMPMPGDGETDAPKSAGANAPIFDESLDACNTERFSNFNGDEQTIKL